MKTTFIYEVDYDTNCEKEDNSPIINKIQVAKMLNPVTEIYFYVLCDKETSLSYYEFEFSERNLFLTEEEAKNFIKKEEENEDSFVKYCVDFDNNCRKFKKRNPFISIGEYIVQKSNRISIEQIKDPIYKHFFNSQLSLSEYLDEETRKIALQTFKFRNNE